MSSSSLTAEIAAEAARLVLDTGLEYGAARHKAARTLTRRSGAARAHMPSNEQIEEEVRTQIEVFHADTQPGELAVLRGIAQHWMARLAPFRPYLGGAVWRGTATRRSAILLDLYCDDPKSAEIELLNMGVRYEVHTRQEAGDDVDILTVYAPCPAFGEPVPVHLAIRDHDALRGALKPDARGRTWRGEIEALQRCRQEADGLVNSHAQTTERDSGPGAPDLCGAGHSQACSPPAIQPLGSTPQSPGLPQDALIFPAGRGLEPPLPWGRSLEEAAPTQVLVRSRGGPERSKPRPRGRS